MLKPAEKKLIFKAGGVTVLIKIADRQAYRKLRLFYKGFICRGNPDICVNVKSPQASVVGVKRNPIFQARSLRLEKEGRFFLLYLRSGNGFSLAKFRPGLKEVDFYSLPEAALSPLYYFLPHILLSLKILKYQGLLLHACSVLGKKSAYLFVAPSGGGKSTLAALALRCRMRVLNDDRVFIRRHKGVFRIYGNPWHGKIEKTLNHSCLVRRVLFLRKAKQNRIRRLSRPEAALKLYENSFYLPLSRSIIKKVFYRCLHLAGNLDVFELSFKPDISIWRFLDGYFKNHPAKK